MQQVIDNQLGTVFVLVSTLNASSARSTDDEECILFLSWSLTVLVEPPQISNVTPIVLLVDTGASLLWVP